jgi:hypothetical protein
MRTWQRWSRDERFLEVKRSWSSESKVSESLFCKAEVTKNDDRTGGVAPGAKVINERE